MLLLNNKVSNLKNQVERLGFFVIIQFVTICIK